MKKYLFGMALMMMGASLFTSCLSNDNNNDFWRLYYQQWSVEQEQW